MESVLIGLAGILIGIFLNEYLRRRSRIEMYSRRMFEKRIDIYEGLMTKVRVAARVVAEALKDSELSDEERRVIAFEAGLTVMQYTDDHTLYLNDDIIVHCGATFVGTGDIFDKQEGRQRDKAIEAFRKEIRQSCDMIEKESGIGQLNKLFKSVTKATYTSPVIDYYRALKKKKEKDK